MPAEPALDCAVFLDRSEQEVVIGVQGDDVANFEGNCQHGPPKNKLRSLPDPVQAFIEAVRLGMFTHSSTPPWQSGAELLGKEVDLTKKQQTWRVRLHHIEPGAFRVLTNILRARLLESVVVRAVARPASPAPASINPTEFVYPSPHQPTPFVLDYEMPERASRERHVHFIFGREPDDAVTTAVYAGLDVWTWLLMLGGYPGENMHPSQSAALPEPAFLLDPHTIEQAFPELFLCDDDCYAAVINWAQIVHRSVCPLEKLELR